MQVVDRSAVIGNRPWPSSAGVLPVLDVAVLAGSGGHPNTVTTIFSQTPPPRHATTAWVPVPPKMPAARYGDGSGVKHALGKAPDAW